MPKLPFKEFREAPNPAVLNAIRNSSSSEYQQRIPEATAANIEDTVNALYRHGKMRNEFVDALVNRIGLEVFRENTWTNPLVEFKKGMMPFGSTIEEVYHGLVDAGEYDSDRDYLEKDLFGQARLDVQSSFHHTNRSNVYKLTMNESMLKRAFLTDMGLSSFTAQMMTAPTTSDSWDEYLLMANLLSVNYEAGGFFKKNVSAVADKASAEDLLIAIRAATDTLAFMSTKYNASKMPMAADKTKLVLITTPEVKARMDVQALAAAFNVEYAEAPQRVIALPAEHWPIPGAQALLTTSDFFMVYDTYLDTTSQINAAGRYTNYFLHHDQIISLSRFVPGMLFTTEAGTPDEVTVYQTTSVSTPTLYDMDGKQVTELTRGYYHQVISSTVTTPVGGPAGVKLALTGGATSPFTRLTETGALMVGVDELATELEVVSVSLDDDTVSATATFPVVGDVFQMWPDPKIVDEPEGTDPEPAG